MLNDEIWKDIDGYNGRYQVSTLGRVRNHQGRIMKPYIQNNGYLMVKLVGWQRHWLVHRLVAITFIPNPMNLPVVNHLDSNRTNNCVSNLEWVTTKQNVAHAKAFGRMVYNKPTLGLKLSGGRQGTSKYHGVFRRDYRYKDTVREKWWAYLCINGKDVERKSFPTELEAAQYYDYLVDKYGVTTKPKNFPNESKCLTTIPKGSTTKRLEMVTTPEGC